MNVQIGWKLGPHHSDRVWPTEIKKGWIRADCHGKPKQLEMTRKSNLRQSACWGAGAPCRWCSERVSSASHNVIRVAETNIRIFELKNDNVRNRSNRSFKKRYRANEPNAWMQTNNTRSSAQKRAPVLSLTESKADLLEWNLRFWVIYSWELCRPQKCSVLGQVYKSAPLPTETRLFQSLCCGYSF